MNARETGIGGILSHPDKNYDFYIVKRKVSMFILMKLTYFLHTINMYTITRWNINAQFFCI